MQSEDRASLVRNRAREIVYRTAGCAEDKHLGAGFELIQEAACLTQAHGCRT
jgi:hypothetical protein